MPVNTTLFQYCPKLVVFSTDKQSVLLAKRKGEADYDGTYTFIGGKVETTDIDLVAGMKREKDEEVGPAVKVNLLPDESRNLLFRKKDGNAMVIPHHPAIFVSGEIELSDEYSDYQWVPLNELEAFEPKVANIPEMANWARHKLSDPNLQLIEI